MIFNRSLATAATALVVALSSLSSANAEEWWHDECSSLKLEARTMLETSPSCALVKALLDGDDILDGTYADVEGVSHIICFLLMYPHIMYLIVITSTSILHNRYVLQIHLVLINWEAWYLQLDAKGAA